MKIIDLLNKIANGEDVPKKIKYNDTIFDYVMQNREGLRYIANDYESYEYDEKFTRQHLFWCIETLNDEVEILEEEKKLHVNDIEFNINNDKRDCIITLDENDLGIDKLHLDNCYFYKENDKWYVKKYDFKSFKLEEEHKIPEKLNLDTDELRGKEVVRSIDYLIEDKINEILDYLEETK